jgi:hypothetical protein
MEPESTTKSKTPTAPALGAGRAAGLGVTPAAERQLDEWETKVLEELKELEKKWVERKKELLSEAKTLREQNVESAVDKAVSIEEYVSMINGLFVEAYSELDSEVESRLEGDDINMSIAAARVNETLEFLRVYAARWVK